MAAKFVALAFAAAVCGAVPFPPLQRILSDNTNEQLQVRVIHDTATGVCNVLSSESAQHRLVTTGNPVVQRRCTQSDEHVCVSKEDIVEIFAESQDVLPTIDSFCSTVTSHIAEEASVVKDEVFEIVKSGDPANRIDVVFLGDGYTEDQREDFVTDMHRLKDDMWGDDTFATYLPVFNVWGVFRPSAESGIGVGGKPKDTAFGLYRDGTELRGIYCSKPMAARSACRSTGSNACDFPSLIGNDEYYGGLGGEFAISTRSETSGTIVLRHEFGHNFGNVGEEYDGGSVYSGANAATTLEQAKSKWGHWMSDVDNARAEDALIRVQDYAWYDLAQGPYEVEFESDGTYARYLLSFSASGVEYDDTLKVSVDGTPLTFTSLGNLDRGFHEYYVEETLSAGTHKLVFESGYPPASDMIRQLCSLTLIEYKGEPEFHFGSEYIGAYPTWNVYNRLVAYRSNNELCLMRNMTSTTFCDVCTENMWLQFFARMELIDDVVVAKDGDMAHVSVNVVPLGQFRPEDQRRQGEEVTIEWFHGGQKRLDLMNEQEWSLPLTEADGMWTVTVHFTTPEVREDPKGLLTSQEHFRI
eukprot:Rmarinus@m.7591